MTPETLAKFTRESRLKSALWWLEQGYDVVPLKPQTKHLYYGYGYRKQHITEPDEALRWFKQSHANLGVVLGGKTDLLVADWDDAQAFQTWCETLGSQINTLTERTARGYHLFFTGRDIKSGAGDGCEIIAKGVCMVTPSVHPSGVQYFITHGAPIAALDSDTAHRLFPFLSKKHGVERRKVDMAIITTHSSEVISRDNGVVAKIKACRSTVEEMLGAGIKLRHSGTDALVGLCPFHDDHHPSLWVSTTTGIWGCNKPTCTAAGCHDVINFRAMFRNISNSDAIREMAKEYLIN